MTVLRRMNFSSNLLTASSTASFAFAACGLELVEWAWILLLPGRDLVASYLKCCCILALRLEESLPVLFSLFITMHSLTSQHSIFECIAASGTAIKMIHVPMPVCAIDSPVAVRAT